MDALSKSQVTCSEPLIEHSSAVGPTDVEDRGRFPSLLRPHSNCELADVEIGEIHRLGPRRHRSRRGPRRFPEHLANETRYVHGWQKREVEETPKENANYNVRYIWGLSQVQWYRTGMLDLRYPSQRKRIAVFHLLIKTWKDWLNCYRKTTLFWEHHNSLIFSCFCEMCWLAASQITKARLSKPSLSCRLFHLNSSLKKRRYSWNVSAFQMWDLHWVGPTYIHRFNSWRS